MQPIQDPAQALAELARQCEALRDARVADIATSPRKLGRGEYERGEAYAYDFIARKIRTFLQGANDVD